jgi:hypothetical protein
MCGDVLWDDGKLESARAEAVTHVAILVAELDVESAPESEATASLSDIAVDFHGETCSLVGVAAL